jgi:hypothetical protein
MTYFPALDPENAVDLKPYNEMLGQLLGEWHENDTDAVAAAMADWLTGPMDDYATSKLASAIKLRAESINRRAEEAKQSSRADLGE